MSSAYPQPGDVLGRYRIERTLGAGSMGRVFEAADLSLHRQVALKVIAPTLAHDPAFRQRFLAEAQAMAALDSAHVVQVFNHGEDRGHLFIVTQLVPGGDLGAMLRQRGVPPLPIALDLLAQAASGLADAHAAGMIHRDLKPGNVLVRDRDGRVTAYLADFGIARPLGEGGAAVGDGTIAGTPSAMAPELHDGGGATVASDIYGLGCVLWWAVTGRAPYVGTDDEVMRAHHEAPVPQLPGTGAQVAAVNEVLRTALAKDPAARYASAIAMRDALRAAARLAGGAPDETFVPGPAGSPLTPQAQASGSHAVGFGGTGDDPSYPSHPGRPTPPAPRRSRTGLLVAAVAGVVLLVVLAAGGLWWAVGRDGDPDPQAGSTASSSPLSSSPSASEPTASASQLETDEVQQQVGDWTETLGFTGPAVTCDGPVAPVAGEEGHCEVRANGQTGWVQVGVEPGSKQLTFHPELPPRILDREVRRVFRKQGMSVPSQCTQYLLGVVGEQLSCSVAEPSEYGEVQLKVTRVNDLLVNFDLQTYYR